MTQTLKPKVSIIIPHYNNFSIIKECIESLENSNYIDSEIIVIKAEDKKL